MFAMEVSKPGRYQDSALGPSRTNFNLMIRAVQGHSGRLGKIITAEKAFVKVEKVAPITHYTKIAHLNTIVGMKGQGLVPGGLTGKGDRTQLYATTAVPEKDGTLPNEHRRRGTDCMVSFFGLALLHI